MLVEAYYRKGTMLNGYKALIKQHIKIENSKC